MSAKDIGREETFKNQKPFISDYLDQMAEDSSRLLFDEMAVIDERYNSDSIVNQGGSKKISRTTDPMTNRTVAKATLIDNEDPLKIENFLREARLTAALQHPNIIPIHDIGIDEIEGPYFIMKLVPGQSLGDIIKILSSPDCDLEYSLTDLMTIFLKICDAVAYAHSKGVVHLDLKPDNVQIGDYGEVLLCDWGLAKILEKPEDIQDFDTDLDPCIYNNITLDGFIRGTPGYMAPEQINMELGAKDKQTDIYALGGILYSLLCLKVPFESETVEDVLKETMCGELVPPSQRIKNKFVPPSLDAVAMKALEFEKGDRYHSVGKLREEIAKWMNGFATEAENAGVFKSAWLLIQRHKAISFLLAIMMISAAAAVYKIKQNEARALKNEQIATQNLNKFLEGKEFTDKLSDDVLIKLDLYYKDRLNAYDFEQAHKQIDKTIRLYPENEVLNVYKGEIYFYTQEFSKADEFFKKVRNLPEKHLVKMAELAPKYASLQQNAGKISAVDLMTLVHSFEGQYKQRILEYMHQRISSIKAYKALLNNPDKKQFIDIHMEFCRLYIIKINENATLRNKRLKKSLNFKYTLSQEGIDLDISNSNFKYMRLIDRLPLRSINVENTFFWWPWIFKHHSLQEINIRNCEIRQLTKGYFKRNKLKVVKLTNKQFRSFVLISQETLDKIRQEKKLTNFDIPQHINLIVDQ